MYVCVYGCVRLFVTLSLCTQYLKNRNFYEAQTLCVGTLYGVEECYCFGGGQRLFEVTRGQTMKTLCTRYLKKGNLDEAHTWHNSTPYTVR